MPSEASLRRLLAWLDAGVDSVENAMKRCGAGSAPISTKNCHAPDDLADETLNRIARRLEEEGSLVEGPRPPLHRRQVRVPRVPREAEAGAVMLTRSLEL